MRYALINAGKIVNIIEADVKFATEVGAVEVPEDISIGDNYANGVFTKEPDPVIVIDWDAKNTEKLNGILVEEGSVVRALALLVLDELNAHAATITAILNAADTATSLATFKTEMAAITDQPQRTQSQLVAALKARMR